MTHRGWLLGVLLLLISASFAGCLGGDDDKDIDPSDSLDEDTGDDVDGNVTGGNVTIDEDGNVNVSLETPVAALAVVGNTTVAPEEEVTFDASASTDADTAAENLTFSWDFGDGATAEGANVTHAFAEEGNFTINLTVTDPEGNIGTANTTIVVASGFSDVVAATLEGTIALPNPVVNNVGASGGGFEAAAAACGTEFECYTTLGGVEGQHFVLHEVEIPAGAAAVVLESVISDPGTLSIVLFDAAGARIDGSGISIAATAAPKLVLKDPATFGTGFTVFVNSAWVPMVDYTITVTALAEVPE